MSQHTFSAGFLFAGLGAGALGFLDAAARLGPDSAGFINLGGVDLEPEACADFSTLTGAPCTQADLATMQPAELRAAWGDEPPDCVFLSPPCKGFSRLLGRQAAAQEKYQALNRLVLQGINLILSTWSRGPAVIVLENVPGIATRGEELLGQVRSLLAGDGYVFHGGNHDCGEVGGLAQHRRRYLLVARDPQRVPGYIYRPPKRRVRGCGEVIGRLPLPEDPDAGAMHVLPGISWLNWCRLAMIPPGGDWRDLPSAHQTQRENPDAHRNKHRVSRWETAAGAVTGASRPGSGAPSVADPRLAHSPWNGTMGVQAWDDAAKAVRGVSTIRNGPAAVSDPRLALGQTGRNAGSFKGRPGLFGVAGWHEALRTVTGSASVSGSNGVAAVADPRLTSPVRPGQERREVFGRHGVGEWGEPVGVVAGSGSNGVTGVADPRLALGCQPRNGAYGVMPWGEAAGAVTGYCAIDNRPASLADPRLGVIADRPVPPGYGWLDLAAALEYVDGRARPAKDRTPVILSPTDGTWHRPLTTLELAALQGIPEVVAGRPLELAGRSVQRHRERIGNAVPVGAARAIANSVLTALLAGRTGWFLMPSGGDVWVRRDDEGRTEYQEVNA